MPWRLIGILVILALFLIFSGFNVHKVNIYFGPFTLADVPLFVVIVFTFILGAITALPFSIIKSYKKKKKLMKEQKATIKESRQITDDSANQTISLKKNTADSEEKKKKSKTKKK